MSDQSLRDDLVRLTSELIAIPSTDDRPDQLQAVIDYAERYAQALPGVFVHRVEYEGKPSLIATLRDTRAPKFMLNAHLDVVAARPEQFNPTVRDGRIYGRASQDMKGSGAVLLRLLRDLAAQPAPPDVGFMFVSDEEIGGERGTGYLAEQGWSCQFFLAAEPTDMQICYAQKGVLWVEATLPGKPAHGSRPWDGTNAIATLRDGLVALEQRFPTPDEPAWLTTVVPTVVQGGATSNRLPEDVHIIFDVRHVPDEQPDQIIAAMQECFDGPVRLVRGGSPLNTNPADSFVQQLAAAYQAVSGQPALLYREHFASDARFYSDLRIPAVCFGPVGAGLHSDEEWVSIDSLVELYHVLARFVAE
ncbi:peptidase M20 [Kouleothrix aurantiaca]|uniref:Peptidase M20 n=1 Tax=Kouleothrix aurantiaca TaxID=186479 RepID=A0A0P9D6Y6_9CHLR|nr:peptidase M20 [Kouleothrix aurantiaca]